MLNGLKVFLFIVIYFFLYSSVNAQVSKDHLKPLLSASDQKNLDKTETLYQKGYAVAAEAEKLREGSDDKEKAEKKYTLKRLEASQYFQKANSLLSSLLKKNISTFQKKNKSLPSDPNVRNKEDHAGELLRQARSIRGVAEDLTYPDEKLSKILEAENVEKEANDILVKVLYAYLNRPLGYDELKYSPASNAETDSAGKVQNYILPSDTVVNDASAKHDTIVPVATEPAIKDEQPVKPVMSTPGDLVLKDTSSLYSMVNVNEDQLDKFNKFLEVAYPDTYANYVIDFRNLNYRDVESLKQAWHLYLYSGNTEIPQKNQPSGKDSLQQYADSGSDHPLPDVAPLKVETKKDSVPEKEVKVASGTGAAKRNITENHKNPETTDKVQKEIQKPVVINTDVNPGVLPENSKTPAAKGFLYRVQISACRIPLDSASLKSVYNGSLPVLELREDDWYKYAVGEFGTYGEAKLLKQTIRVPGAFVIAYLNGKRISIPKPDETFSSFSAGNSGITYKVQIIAAKKQLDGDYIRHVYSGNHNVEEIFEEGWYKYAVVIGASLDEAKNFISRENIPGAFITSYVGGKKVELKDAIRLDKSKQ